MIAWRCHPDIEFGKHRIDLFRRYVQRQINCTEPFLDGIDGRSERLVRERFSRCVNEEIGDFDRMAGSLSRSAEHDAAASLILADNVDDMFEFFMGRDGRTAEFAYQNFH